MKTYLSSLLLEKQTYFQFPSSPVHQRRIRKVEEFTFRANPYTVFIFHSFILSFCNNWACDEYMYIWALKWLVQWRIVHSMVSQGIIGYVNFPGISQSDLLIHELARPNSKLYRCINPGDANTQWLFTPLFEIWAASWQNQQNDCALSEESDQPGHPPSLIRVFAVRTLGSLGPKLSSCGQRRLWSDWADSQADLSVRWAHMPFCWFCHEAAHLKVYDAKLWKILPFIKFVHHSFNDIRILRTTTFESVARGQSRTTLLTLS